MRGIERLRKLAEDTIEGELLWCTLENGTEASWGVTCEDDRRLSDALSEIADEIESDARELSPELGKLMAEITGKGYEGCESFTDWLGKWYMPRPTYADGELVQIGDNVAGLKGPVTSYDVTYSGTPYQYWEIYSDVASIGCNEGDFLEPIKRLYDRDGVEIRVGDTVYTLPGKAGKVSRIGEGVVHFEGEPDDFAHNASALTHEKRDSLERIEADAMKAYFDYWGCAGVGCSECPARIDGKRPYEQYGTGANCADAQVLDLLRRQRDVSERG